MTPMCRPMRRTRKVVSTYTKGVLFEPLGGLSVCRLPACIYMEFRCGRDKPCSERAGFRFWPVSLYSWKMGIFLWSCGPAVPLAEQTGTTSATIFDDCEDWMGRIGSLLVPTVSGLEGLTRVIYTNEADSVLIWSASALRTPYGIENLGVFVEGWRMIDEP